MKATLTNKLTNIFPLLRKLGFAYLAVSAGMFMFGFISTLIYQLT